MAKKSSIEKNNKRIRLYKKYAPIRAELKKILQDANSSEEAFQEAQRKLANLPRNSSKVRIRNRCSITGRARGYVGRFGVSRITFRELAANAKIPGVTKSSW